MNRKSQTRMTIADLMNKPLRALSSGSIESRSWPLYDAACRGVIHQRRCKLILRHNHEQSQKGPLDEEEKFGDITLPAWSIISACLEN